MEIVRSRYLSPANVKSTHKKHCCMTYLRNFLLYTGWSGHRIKVRSSSKSRLVRKLYAFVWLIGFRSQGRPADSYKNSSANAQRPKLCSHTRENTSADFASLRRNFNTPVNNPAKKVCVVCKKEGYKVAECYTFQPMDIDDRVKVVGQHMLCRTCLSHHGNWLCKTWKGCGIEGCCLRNHTMLYTATLAVPFVVSTSHSESLSAGSPIFRIIPLTLYVKEHRMKVFSFVDEAS